MRQWQTANISTLRPWYLRFVWHRNQQSRLKKGPGRNANTLKKESRWMFSTMNLVGSLDFACWHSCHVELPMVEATILGIAAWHTKTHENFESEATGDSNFSVFPTPEVEWTAMDLCHLPESWQRWFLCLSNGPTKKGKEWTEFTKWRWMEMEIQDVALGGATAPLPLEPSSSAACSSNGGCAALGLLTGECCASATIFGFGFRFFSKFL